MMKIYCNVSNKYKKSNTKIIISEENISQEFRLKNIDKTRNYSLRIKSK